MEERAEKERVLILPYLILSPLVPRRRGWWL
jgi:hypothetical protein